MNLEKIVTKVAKVLGDAGDIAGVLVEHLPTFINLADEAGDLLVDTTKALAGADKYKLVKSMAEALLNELRPDLVARFGAFWSVAGPFVTLLVQLRKLGLVKF